MNTAATRPFSLALLLAVLEGCATAPSSPAGGGSKQPPKVGSPMPSVVVKSFEGQEMASADLKGKVVLYDIWASWCGPCKEELPLLDAMAGRLKSKGVEIVAISIDEDRDAAVQFLKAHSGEWSLSLAHDPEGRVPDRLKPPKMPTSYIVDREGVVRFINAGFDRSDAAEFEARLTALAR